MTIVLISGSASGTFACRMLADRLRRADRHALVVSKLEKTTNSPFPTALIEADLRLSPNEFLNSPLLEKITALGVFLDGNKFDDFVISYRRICRESNLEEVPIFSGPLYPLVGDALIHDLAARQRADVLLVHGQRQLDEVAAMTFNWSDVFPTVIAAGLWFMPERPGIGQLSGHGLLETTKSTNTLLMVAQSDVPNTKRLRLDLFQRLWSISTSASPEDWKVIIAMDHQRETPTTWTTDERIQKGDKPANLFFTSQERLLSHIAECDVCVTVSSPWILTAMAWGKRVMLIGDYGIKGPLRTTPFLGSGAMHNLENFSRFSNFNKLTRINQHWLNSMGWAVFDGPTRLIKALESHQPANLIKP
ncbi:DUF6716 putative glycosyltransferase [Synechococcus sp. MIT S1220]|uniref:DUF6716 putative glycosyltransferase n=1 Tax=Synechococcus sp. MIT S1220 TaxID=3082549 RepID=UPI0039B07A74